jgi:RecA/RadA recombinase
MARSRINTAPEVPVAKKKQVTKAALKKLPRVPAEVSTVATLAKAGFPSQWPQANNVFVPPAVIPTCFIQFDRGTKVGGFPLERICTLHGESANGKSGFANGLALSFIQAGHFALKIDSEYTDTSDWMHMLMGEQANNPLFRGLRPKCYEDAIDNVQAFGDWLLDAREAGNVHEERSAIVIVDSIKKLQPKALLAKIAKEGAAGLGGRSAQLKAAMNATWIDDLTPKVAHWKIGFVFVARESERSGATDMDRQYGRAWKVTGGEALIYDSSLVMRAKRAAWVYDKKGEDRKAIGERFRIRIWKSKISSKDAEHSDTYFHTSLGTVDGIPEGFDFARDALELALHYGIVELAGSSYRYQGKSIGQGELNTVRALTGTDTLSEIQAACRARFDKAEHIGQDDESQDEVDA